MCREGSVTAGGGAEAGVRRGEGSREGRASPLLSPAAELPGVGARAPAGSRGAAEGRWFPSPAASAAEPPPPPAPAGGVCSRPDR